MFALIAALALAPNLMTDGKPALLSPVQKAGLLKGSYKILVPTYVPAGFKPTVAKIADSDKPIDASLTLTYTNKATKGEFTVQMASEGLGDPLLPSPEAGDTVEPTGILKTHSPILGKVDLEYYVKGKYRVFDCTWVDVSKKGYPRSAMIMGSNLAPSEGKKILESLRWLKR